MQTVTNVTLDIARPYFPPTIHAKQYDSDTRYISISAVENGVEWPIPPAIGVVNVQKPDGKVCFYENRADGEKAVRFDGNTATFVIVPEALTAAGEAYGDLSLYNSDRERLTTFLFRLAIEKAAVPDESVTSTNYYNVLTQEIAAAIAASEQVANLAGFRILGYYDTEDALFESVLNPLPGDAYGIGTDNPHDIYVWDGVRREWKNTGPMKGERGPTGEAAGFGEPEASVETLPEEQDATFTVEASGPDTAKVFKLHLGIPQGKTGETGAVGPQGMPGKGLTILGTYATIDDLTLAVLMPEHGDAYGIGDAAPYDVYIWDGVRAEWTNFGNFRGDTGPQGETGPEGSQGPQGPQGPQGEPGQSAYASAQAGGYSGTEKDFYDDLAAMDGMAAWFAGY